MLIFTLKFYLVFKNTALRSNLAAFPKIKTTVSMIFSDISWHAHNRKFGFMVTILMPIFI